VFKLIGVDVYNEANETIGNIEELILDKSGKVEHVVLGVGGFLGMGEHYVAVAFDKLKWVNERVRSTTASTAPAALHPLKMLTAARERQRTERQKPRQVLLPLLLDLFGLPTSSGILIMRSLTPLRIS
jgi:sporulation protein YlmC with PRC-barrel domain